VDIQPSYVHLTSMWDIFAQIFNSPGS